MIIKNINGTSQKKCKCGNWLQHWKNYSKRSAKVCHVKSCIQTDLEAAFVQKNDDNEGTWYIVPLCHWHSKALGKVELITGTILVAVNNILTCEKPENLYH